MKIPIKIVSSKHYQDISNSFFTLRKNLLSLTSELTQKTEDEITDPIELLKETISNLKKVQAEKDKQDEIRVWKEQGLTQFMRTIRTEQHNVKNLCDQLLSDLVKHLGATQGAIFLKDEPNDSSVKLISTYAWGRRKFLEQEVEEGEGLIGQCMLEKDSIYLTDVPDSFIQIRSGLGQGEPRCIFIIPLIANEQLLGVLELASFNEFTEHQIDFLNGLLENLASTLLYEVNNQKTRKLLETTREQQEQMRAQEEEMRQNLEELQATQEAQARLNNDLKENEALLNAKLKEAELAKKALEEKEGEMQKLADKSKKRALQFREKMEELDVLLEQKNAEINEFKRQTEIQQEQMRAQEEELRQNLEELEATQEEMKRQGFEIQRFSNAIDKSAIIIDFDSSGTVLHVNELFCETLGFNRDEAIGKPHTFYVPVDAQKTGAFESLWAEIKKGKHFIREVKRLKKNGDIFWLRASYMPMFNQKNEIEKVSCICYDITEEVEQRIIVRQKQAQMDGLINNTPGMVYNCLFDENLTMIFASQKSLDIFGYPPEDFVSGKVNQVQFILKEDYEKAVEEVEKGLQENGAFDVKYRIKDREGNIKWVWDVGSAVKADEDDNEMLEGLILDITQQKLLEEASKQQMEEIRASEEELRQNMEELAATQEEMEVKQAQMDGLINNTPGLIYNCKLDKNWTMLFASKKAAEICGYEAEDLMDGSIHLGDLIVEEDAERVAKGVEEGLKKFGTFDLEYQIKTKTGEIKWVRDVGTKVKLKNENILEGLIIDITPQKNMEFEALQSMEELMTTEMELREEIEQLKSQLKNQ